MLHRFQRGFAIVRMSGGVLWQHPKLVVLPIISGIAFVAFVLLLTVIGIPALISLLHGLQANSNMAMALALTILFVAYFSVVFLILFFNAALIYCVLQCLADEKPSLLGGLALAGRRTAQIAAWAVVASSVGLLIKGVQSVLKDNAILGGIVGSLLGNVLGVGWATVTYFVMPLVVIEGLTPFAAVKESAKVLRRTWGETVSGAAGLGLMFSLAILPAMGGGWLVGKLGLSAMIGPGGMTWLALAGFIYLVAAWTIFATLGTIFRTGAYVYAVTGEAPAGMNRDLLTSIFRKR